MHDIIIVIIFRTQYYQRFSPTSPPYGLPCTRTQYYQMCYTVPPPFSRGLNALSVYPTCYPYMVSYVGQIPQV
jgi:hypothetical protein